MGCSAGRMQPDLHHGLLGRWVASVPLPSDAQARRKFARAQGLSGFRQFVSRRAVFARLAPLLPGNQLA